MQIESQTQSRFSFSSIFAACSLDQIFFSLEAVVAACLCPSSLAFSTEVLNAFNGLVKKLIDGIAACACAVGDISTVDGALLSCGTERDAGTVCREDIRA